MTTHTVPSENGNCLLVTEKVANGDYSPINEKAHQKMTFDSVLEQIGTFGPHQRVIFICISMAEFFGAFHILLAVFAGAEPDWYCSSVATNASDAAEGTTWPGVNYSEAYKQCTIRGKECQSYVFTEDITTIVSEWNLVCPGYAFVSDLITSIQMVGLLLGAGTNGQLSELIGRKKSFFLAFLIMTAGGLGSAFANSWKVYAACRFIVGFGFGGNQVVQCVFPMEFLGKKWRVMCGTLGFWALGVLVLTLVAYLLPDWRHLTIATSASCFLYFLTWWFIPESPRWLIQHGHMDEAEQIMNKIARKNNKPAPNIQELKRIVEEEARVSRNYTYIDLFRTWTYAKTTMIKFLTWFTVFVLYYSGSYNVKNFSGDRYFNMALSSIIDWLAMLSVIPVLTFMGRRKGNWMYLGTGLVMVLSIWFIILTGKNVQLASLILGFALIAKSSGLAGTYSAQIYSAELFPTAIRNLGVGAGSIAARLGGILAPQMVFLGTVSQASPYIITSALCCIVIPLLLLLPETKGRVLEDTYVTSMKADKNASEEEMKAINPPV